MAYAITDPKVGDNEQVQTLVEQATANLPRRRIETLAYDKACDDQKVHEYLHQQRIKPLIHNRSMWQGDKEVSLAATTGKRYPLNVVYDEAGTVCCYDTVSDPAVRHRMAYMGYEKNLAPPRLLSLAVAFCMSSSRSILSVWLGARAAVAWNGWRRSTAPHSPLLVPHLDPDLAQLRRQWL